MIKNDISLYVAHTNFDNAEEGTNTSLANLIKSDQVISIEKLDFDQDEPSTGRVLVLEKPLKLEQYIKGIKKSLHLETIKLIGDLSSMIKRIAIVGGSGSSFINLAREKILQIL